MMFKKSIIRCSSFYVTTKAHNLAYCYKSVQSRVTCFFTGQYDTEEYGTIAGVI